MIAGLDADRVDHNIAAECAFDLSSQVGYKSNISFGLFLLLDNFFESVTNRLLLTDSTDWQQPNFAIFLQLYTTISGKFGGKEISTICTKISEEAFIAFMLYEAMLTAQPLLVYPDLALWASSNQNPLFVENSGLLFWRNWYKFTPGSIARHNDDGTRKEMNLWEWDCFYR